MRLAAWLRGLQRGLDEAVRVGQGGRWAAATGRRASQWVRAQGWPGPVRLVAFNHGLSAAALRLVEGLDEQQAILVMPLWALSPLATGEAGSGE
jgi:hypothetical protein